MGSFGPNGYGLYDMAGNAWEWVSSLYKSYPYDANDGRENPNTAGQRVLRGGSYVNFPYGLRVAYRGFYYPSDTDYASGLRCARSQ